VVLVVGQTAGTVVPVVGTLPVVGRSEVTGMRRAVVGMRRAGVGMPRAGAGKRRAVVGKRLAVGKLVVVMPQPVVGKLRRRPGPPAEVRVCGSVGPFQSAVELCIWHTPPE